MFSVQLKSLGNVVYLYTPFQLKILKPCSDNQQEAMEDGEIEDGFLGHHEMESRRALAAAHGAEGSVSWVEAVLLGAGDIAPLNEAEDEEDEDLLPENRTDCATDRREPQPPGTAADLPPPSAAVLARREAALVHSVTALLREGDDSEALLDVLTKAASNGVDVMRWLGHGRSSIGGRTPLMEAAMQGRTACCAVLADAARSRGRGLNARNERGRYSALHYACYHGAGGAALELLVRGADPRLRNMGGETALQSALNNGRNECAELVSDFLRRPTFEPETGVAAGVAKRGISEEGRGRRGENIGGGVVGAAPEVCRANAIFCLGRRRRRSGARVRPGRGLGIGVGTAGAEVGLGARRGARLHATNPFAGTPMEAFVLWSIASGYDPFHGEGACQEEDEEENQSATGRSRGGGNGATGSAGVWLEYYIRVYNASLRRWYQQQRSLGEARSCGPKSAGDPGRTGAVGGGNQAACYAPEVQSSAREGSTYSLVVQKSKALEEGRRIELRCGSNLVIGRSQNLAGIVIKDELVSKSHLRIVNSVERGVRLCDLGSKHGAVITKPAPNTAITKSPHVVADKQRAERGGGGGGSICVGRPPGLGGKDPPIVASGNSSTSTLKPNLKPPPPPPNPPKQKFYPIPIPREPEWVAGEHGDRISLGKTVLILERKGGPEPSGLGGRQSVRVETHTRAGTDAASAVAPRVQKQRRPAVISKRFTVNPNLMDAIRSAEEMERARKRTAAASELAAAAAAEYMSNKRARSASPSAASPPCTNLLPSTSRVSRAGGSEGSAGTGAGGAAPAASVGDGGGWSEGRDDYGHVSKGSMLLKRMGWTEGQGLGRRSDGQLQPIRVERRGERAGLGTVQGSDNNPFAVGADGRISKWEQMRRRFAEAQSAGPGFGGAKRTGSGAGVRWLKGGVQKGLG